jgi:phage terminase large subunit
MTREELERKVAIKRELKRRKSLQKAVFGVVEPQIPGGDPKLLRCWQRDDSGQFVASDRKPQVLVPLKLERFLTIPKKYKVLYGGRGSAKSMTAMDAAIADAKDFGGSTMCFREVQKSLKESIFKGLMGEIKRLGFDGFRDVESQGEIKNDNNGALFSFWGLSTNLDNMKSLYGYKRFLTEEADSISQRSLEVMGPTLRGIDGAEMWFIFNPKSREAPVSKRFIMPFEHHLMSHGVFEDDHHLIIKMNWRDNPWFLEDETLRQEMEADRKLVDEGVISQAKFDHVWEGEFDDHIENALISSDWFDACVDAHKKLGFEGRGFRFAAHDPSDLGQDPKGYAARHGSVIYDVQEKVDGDIHQGGDWAIELAKEQGVEKFSWDGDGMGVGLRRQISEEFYGTHVGVSMFRGSEGVDNPEQIYQPAIKHEVMDGKTNKEAFKNKRAQYYQTLRDKIYNTWRAVTYGEYKDPDTLISFSSDIKLLLKLRSELCKMPVKENSNGLIELYTKEQMQRLFQLPSPNLADCVMMLQRVKEDRAEQQQVHIPPVIRPMSMRR